MTIRLFGDVDNRTKIYYAIRIFVAIFFFLFAMSHAMITGSFCLRRIKQFREEEKKKQQQ